MLPHKPEVLAKTVPCTDPGQACREWHVSVIIVRVVRYVVRARVDRGLPENEGVAGAVPLHFEERRYRPRVTFAFAGKEHGAAALGNDGR